MHALKTFAQWSMLSDPSPFRRMSVSRFRVDLQSGEVKWSKSNRSEAGGYWIFWTTRILYELQLNLCTLFVFYSICIYIIAWLVNTLMLGALGVTSHLMKSCSLRGRLFKRAVNWWTGQSTDLWRIFSYFISNTRALWRDPGARVTAPKDVKFHFHSTVNWYGPKCKLLKTKAMPMTP